MGKRWRCFDSWLKSKNVLGFGSKGNASNKTVFVERIDTEKTYEYIKAKEQIIRNMEVEHMYAGTENGDVYYVNGGEISI